MNRPLMRTFPGLLAALLFSSVANAQLFRAYVASTGSDANPCTLPAPCRLLPAALAAVAANGEIWMLDSANYNTGQVFITKSVTILAVPGEVGSLVAQAGSPAMLIALEGLEVRLRNLVIVNNVNNPGTDGVHMSAGAVLKITGCLIAGMPSRGIVVSTAANVSVSHTEIRDALTGIGVSGGASVDISNVNISGAGSQGVIGVASAPGTTTRIAISDSHFTNNSFGAYAFATEGTATVRISVTRSSFSMGSVGVSSQVTVPGGVASLSVSNSLLSGLGTAFLQFGSGAVVESFGNNAVRDNSSNVSGTLSPVASM